jgi:hypothetical protein
VLLSEELRDGRLALGLGPRQGGAAILVEQLGVGPGSQQGPHARLVPLGPHQGGLAVLQVEASGGPVQGRAAVVVELHAAAKASSTCPTLVQDCSNPPIDSESVKRIMSLFFNFFDSDSTIELLIFTCFSSIIFFKFDLDKLGNNFTRIISRRLPASWAVIKNLVELLDI